ncbi:MAG: YgiQ family radical SAM protein [Deferrisomatales bacterium]
MPPVPRLLPETPERDGDTFDIVLVTGDAYVDHPAFGAALVGRYLEGLGYRVGILAQPDWKSAADFRRFGRPRLFFGVTAGNLDSIVAHYTPERQRRRRDDYSPGGQAGRRPDYASIVYAQRCKEAFPEVPVVMGGVEASLRRLAQYDFVQEMVRGSVLIDGKADFLVYGMAERGLRDLAAALARGAPRDELEAIRGLAYRTSRPPAGDEVVTLPSLEETAASPEGFFEFYRALRGTLLRPAPPVVVQPHGLQAVVVNPPADPLSPRELDALYDLPFTRRFPERYDAQGGIPALEPVRFSVVTHRGCYGGCSFCAISAHQGRGVVSRTPDAVVAEVRRLASDPEFRGTVQDVGGPTANMYGTGCKKAGPGRSGCDRPSCLVPDVCPLLETSGGSYLELLRSVRRVSGVKHAFVASGLRYDLLMMPGQRRLMRELMQHHVGGHLKVAPEHVTSRTLRLMRKPLPRKWREFRELFDQLRQEVDKPIYLVPYLMTGHPGSDLRDAVDQALFAKEMGHFVEQVQDFTPTPMTASACMFHTGRDPDTGDAVLVPKGKEKRVQRALVQFRDARNRDLLTRYFEGINRRDVLRKIYGGAQPAEPRQARPRGRPPEGAARAVRPRTPTPRQPRKP